MVGFRDQFFRNIFHEGFFRGKRSLASGGQTDALAHTEHMGVDWAIPLSERLLLFG